MYKNTIKQLNSKTTTKPQDREAAVAADESIAPAPSKVRCPDQGAPASERSAGDVWCAVGRTEAIRSQTLQRRENMVRRGG